MHTATFYFRIHLGMQTGIQIRSFQQCYHVPFGQHKIPDKLLTDHAILTWLTICAVSESERAVRCIVK